MFHWKWFWIPILSSAPDQHYQTDGGGPDINAQYLHLHAPIKIHYPNYNTHQKFLQLDILPFLLYDVN